MVNLVLYGSGMADSICSKTGRCEPLKGVSRKTRQTAGMPSSARRLLHGNWVDLAEKRVYKPHQRRLDPSRLRVIASLTGADHLQRQLRPHIGQNGDRTPRADRHQRYGQIVVSAPERKLLRARAVQNAHGLRDAAAASLIPPMFGCAQSARHVSTETSTPVRLGTL